MPYAEKDSDDEYAGGYDPYDNYNAYEEDDDTQNDEKGFEKRQNTEEDIFIFKKVQLPGIPKN